MFGIGWPELLLIGIVALFVVDPKDLPTVLYKCGRGFRSLKLFYIQMQNHVEETFRDLEANEINKEIKEKSETARLIGHGTPLPEQPKIIHGDDVKKEADHD